MSAATTTATTAAMDPIGAVEKDGYRVELYAHDERIKVWLGGEVIADTTRPLELRESRLAPTWYVPLADVRAGILEPSDHRTYCPYKGEAAYWSIRLGDRIVENAVWAYPAPIKGLAALKDYVAFYPDRVDDIELVGKPEPQTQVVQLGSGVDRMSHWFVEQAWRARNAVALTKSLIDQLQSMDMGLMRLFVGVWVLHPQVRSTTFSWEVGQDEVNYRPAPHRTEPLPDYVSSPLRPITEDHAPEVRFRLTDSAAIADYPLLRRLAEAGGTDYLALPMPFANDQINTLAVTTDRPSGFSDEQVAALRNTMPMLGRLYEAFSLRETAHALLDTYIGRHASERVLYGQVKRGDGERIRAAMWFCDLRGFTSHAETLPEVEMIGLLNDFFGMVNDAIDRHGGEILKFIGDAVLAIFPLHHGADPGEVCRAAYQAARDARTAVEIYNLTRGEERPALDFGIALHLGEVLYGNIGAPHRLDFTVIGPAVNLVSRIEGLCSELGEPILVSQAFSDAVPGQFTQAGCYKLKGIAAEQPVFVPAAKSSRESQETGG